MEIALAIYTSTKFFTYILLVIHTFIYLRNPEAEENVNLVLIHKIGEKRNKRKKLKFKCIAMHNKRKKKEIYLEMKVFLIRVNRI